MLDEPAIRIPAASIRKVWIRGRGTKTGAIIGGIVVGVSSALLGAAAGAFCESDCGDFDVYQYGAIGFATGAGMGALTGGIVGAAFPKWHRLVLGGSPAAKMGGGVAPGRVGAFSIQGGRALGRDRNSGSGGFGGRLGLSAQLPGGLAPGLEFGRFGLGRGSVPSPRGRALNFTESVSHFGLSLTKTRDRGRLRPYGLAASATTPGAASTRWRSIPTSSSSIPRSTARSSARASVAAPDGGRDAISRSRRKAAGTRASAASRIRPSTDRRSTGTCCR
ncbi:MAG TPA: hypothetical protein VIK51_15230 [Vicinamibacteria bacterium]